MASNPNLQYEEGHRRFDVNLSLQSKSLAQKEIYLFLEEIKNILLHQKTKQKIQYCSFVKDNTSYNVLTIIYPTFNTKSKN